MDIWSVLILFSIGQGVFTLALIALKSREQKRGSIWLFAILLTLLWFQVEFYFIRTVFDTGISLFYGTRLGSWLLLGPLVLFYICSITEDKWSFSVRMGAHLLPFVLFFGILPLIFTELLSYRQVHYGMLTVFNPWPDEVLLPMHYVYGGVFALQFIHLGGYVFIARKRIKAYSDDLKTTHSDIQQNKIRWLSIFNYGFLATLILAAVFLCILLFTPLYRRYFDYVYVLPMSLITYLVAFNLSGVKWKIKEPATELEKYKKSGLSSGELSSLSTKLRVYMEEERPFLNNELRLKDLAEALETPSHHLSQVISQEMNTTFFDLINKYRIEEAKKKIKEKPEFTLIQIGFDSGFNNKTSFVNAFKKFEKRTPSAYWKQVNKTG